MPCYFCARLAREHGVTTLIAGDGGDELFAGNARYLKDRVFDYWSYIPARARSALAKLLDVPARWDRERHLLARARRYVAIASRSPAERLMMSNAFATRPDEDMFDADFLAQVDPLAPGRFADALFDGPPGHDKLQKMLQFDLRITLADSDIRKVNHACALAAVDVRYPFLDEDLGEFAGQIPSALLTKGGNLRGSL